MRLLPRALFAVSFASLLPSLAMADPFDGIDTDPDVVVQEPDGDIEVKDSSRVQAADRVLGPEHDFRERRRVVLVGDDGRFSVLDANQVRQDDPRVMRYQDRSFRRWQDGRWVTWNGMHPGWHRSYTVVRSPVVHRPIVRRLGRVDRDENPYDGWLLDTDGDGLYG